MHQKSTSLAGLEGEPAGVAPGLHGPGQHVRVSCAERLALLEASEA